MNKDRLIIVISIYIYIYIYIYIGLCIICIHKYLFTINTIEIHIVHFFVEMNFHLYKSS